MNKGIFWSIELIIGILMLSSIINTLPEKNNQQTVIPLIHCHDIITVWSQGEKEIEYYTQLLKQYYPAQTIQTSQEPIRGKKQNQTVCKGTRYQSGKKEILYVLIEW